jgi:site-specific DNA-methyltransferase (adenine-specific)
VIPKVILSSAANLLSSLGEESVQVVFADPPYGIAYHSNHYKGKNPHHPISSDWDFQIQPFLSQVGRVLRPGGALYLCTRWDVHPIWAPSIVPPLKLSNVIVWKKDNWSAGDLEGNFGNQYELLLFITKGRHKVRGHRWPNVWEFPRVPAKKLWMPAEKPQGLVRRAIEASSDPGDLVIDPFAGSGTTGCASLPDRECILGDLDPRMIRIIHKRLNLPLAPDFEITPQEETPVCPVFEVEPPSPHLWGLHPEDLAHSLSKDSNEE